MTDSSSRRLQDEITDWIQQTQRPITIPPREPVNRGAIRLWTSVMNSVNPVTHPKNTAPHSMLPTWTLPEFTLHQDTARSPVFSGEAFERLDSAGFTAIVATDIDLQFVRAAEIGESVSETFHVSSISTPKQTALGAGFFLTIRSSFETETGILGTADTRVLKFCPAVTQGEEPEVPTAPNENHPLELEVTAALIAAGAVATSDFQYSHLDPHRARRAGTPDVIMNIHTLTGLMEHALRSQQGASDISRLAVRLGLPILPGDKIRFEVSSAVAPDNDRSVGITVKGARGLHAKATAELNR